MLIRSDGAPSTAAGIVPTDVAGLKVWLRSDLGVTLNGPNVSAWADQSVNGNNVVQAVAADQPLFVASPSGGPNSLPYIEFDGVTEYLRGSWAEVQPSHVFAVLLPSMTYTANETQYDGTVVNTRRLFVPAVGQLQIYSGAFGPLLTGITTTVWQRTDAVFSGANSILQLNTYDQAIYANAGASASNGLTIGADGGFIGFCDTRIMEFLMYDNVVSTDDHLGLDHYLFNRYGI